MAMLANAGVQQRVAFAATLEGSRLPAGPSTMQRDGPQARALRQRHLSTT